MGRVVRNAGWFPDYQLRLIERGAAHFDPARVVHEVPIVDGSGRPSRLAVGPLQLPHPARVHPASRSATVGLDARRWLITYGRPRGRAVVGQPIREFWRRFVSLRGYREGPLGLLLSVLLAWYTGKAVWLARHSTRLERDKSA